MNDLHAWLSQQHHGLRTFQIFQQKLATLSRDEPGQRALCRLLNSLVGGYIEAFDEEPLPVAVADRGSRLSTPTQPGREPRFSSQCGGQAGRPQ
jgi:hypothetical protein